jgi:hypothetical protein
MKWRTFLPYPTHDGGGDRQRRGRYGTNRDHRWDIHRSTDGIHTEYLCVTFEPFLMLRHSCMSLRLVCAINAFLFVEKFSSTTYTSRGYRFGSAISHKRLIQPQIDPGTISADSCHLPESSQKYLWHPPSSGEDRTVRTILQPLSSFFSCTLNSHLTWHTASPLPLRERI